MSDAQNYPSQSHWISIFKEHILWGNVGMNWKLYCEVCVELSPFLPSLEIEGGSRKRRQGALNWFCAGKASWLHCRPCTTIRLHFIQFSKMISKVFGEKQISFWFRLIQTSMVEKLWYNLAQPDAKYFNRWIIILLRVFPSTGNFLSVSAAFSELVSP